MISFHLDWIHAQLQQAYAGMALAVSAGRTFVLPKVCAHACCSMDSFQCSYVVTASFCRNT